MRNVKTDRYQKQSSPEPETIDFSGPVIGAKPSSDAQADGDEKTPRKKEPSNDRSGETPNDPPNDPASEGTNGRPDGERRFHNHYMIAVPQDRSRVRHTFGIFEDQKRALDRLQMAIEDFEGDKPTLGEMVQGALDAYIRKRTMELPNVRLSDRPNERSVKEGDDEGTQTD